MPLLLGFSHDPTHVYLRVLLLSGCGRRAVARLVRLQSGNLEEPPPPPVFWISQIIASMGRPASSLAADRPPERTHWANTLLVLGKDEREKLFRKFLDLKEKCCVSSIECLFEKRFPAQWPYMSISGNKNHISKRKEGSKERKDGRKNDGMNDTKDRADFAVGFLGAF